MLLRITKAVFALFAALTALAFVVVVALGAWLLTGPKELRQLLPTIEASLNPQGTAYHTEVGNLVVRWDNVTQPVDIRLQHVSVYSADKSAKLTRFNEVSVGLNLGSLLRLRIEPKSIVLHRPSLRFFRDAEGRFWVGIGSEESQRVPLDVLSAQLQKNDTEDGQANPLFGNVKEIRILGARVTLDQADNARLIEAEEANLHILRAREDITIQADVSFRYKEAALSYLRGNIRLAGKDDAVQANLELRDFSPHILSQFLPDYPVLAALDVPLSGFVSAYINPQGQVQLVDFRLHGQEGRFTYDDYFAEPLSLQSIKLEGQVRDGFTHYALKKAEMQFGEAKLTVHGTANRHTEGWTADALAVAENMPVNDLYKYWPKVIAPTPYQWVTTHIREGVVPRAEAKLLLTEEHLGKPFPEEALAVQIQATGVTVDYLDGYPKVQDVAGLVEFSGKGMTITSQKGRMLSGAVLKDAWLNIPDLGVDAAPMHIKLAVEAPARDVASYIGVPVLDFATPLGMNPDTITGKARGTLEFNFLLPDGDVEDDDPHLQFIIDAEIENAAQPGFMDYEQVTDASGKLRITEKELTYNGMMSVSGAPLRISLTHDFHAPAGEFPTVYQAKGDMTVEQLRAFHVPELPFLSGVVGVDAHIRRTPDIYNLVVTADLQRITADLPKLGLSKSSGVPSMLDFEAEIKGGNLSLRRFALKGEEMRILGSAEVGENLSRLTRLQLDKVEFADNNFSATVTQQDGRYAIQAKGASLDMQPFFAHDVTAEEDAQPTPDESESIPFTLQGTFDWLVFGKGRELRNVTLQGDCRVTHCESLRAEGMVGRDDRFQFHVARGADNLRRLTFNAANAGGFLRAVDFYDGMSGGELRIAGAFDDMQESRPFTGELRVTEHRITNAPVLAKIASLLSLSGIGDALRGEGISFTKIESELGFADDILTFSKGRAYGSSLGVTVEDGAVNLENRQVKVSGTVVPSYTLNSALGNIPVIGTALSGGKGEGVFAATYSVEGQYPDGVEVSVNPLSMLAPGFLRNIFGGGESAEEAVKTAPATGDAPAASDSNPPSLSAPPAEEATTSPAASPTP